MAILNFPDPNVATTYIANGKSWSWDGESWVSSSSENTLVGFTGSQGSNGFTGSQGVVGFTGSIGFTGSQGGIGFTGSQGVVGFTGSIGFTGSQGGIGFTGSQGSGASYPSFTGNSGKVLAVNTAEDDVEWVTQTGGSSSPTVNNQSGTSYTLVLSDANNILAMTSESSNDVLIPNDSTANFPIGSSLVIIQAGAGLSTISADSGVTLNGISQGSVQSQAQHTALSLVKIANNSWNVFGGLPNPTVVTLPAETSSSVILGESDFAGNVVRRIGSSIDLTVTIPVEIVNAEPVTVIRTGVGNVTFVADSGVTIKSALNQLKIGSQYGAATLISEGSDSYILIGDLSS